MPQFPCWQVTSAIVYAVVHVLVSRNTECWVGVVCCCSDCLLMALSVANPVTRLPFWVELANMQSCSFPYRQIPEKTVFVRMQAYFLDSVVCIHWCSLSVPSGTSGILIFF